MSEPIKKPPRHMGLVVDPSVEGLDGEGLLSTPSPTSQTDVDALRASTQTQPSWSDEPAGSKKEGQQRQAGLNEPSAEPPSTPQDAETRTGHPVRDRLLAKARQARARSGTNPIESLDQPTATGPVDSFSSLDNVSAELEVLANRTPDLARPVRAAGASLSARSVSVFAVLIGIALVATLFTLLIQFAPKDASVASYTVPTAKPQPQVAVSSAVTALEPPELPKRKRQKGPWRIESASSGQRLVRGTVGKRAFLSAVQGAGLSKNQAYRVYNSLKGTRNLDRCAPRHEFAALLDGSGEVKAFEYIVSDEEVYQARENKQGKLAGKRLDLKVKKQRAQGALVVTGTNFGDDAKRGGFHPTIGRVLDKALDGHTGVSHFSLGDRLRVIAQEVTVLGQFSRYAGIEALEYLPATGKPLRIYYFGQRRKYFDARGRAPGEGGWRKPVRGPITSKFNPKRMHPILKKRMPHNGTDFGAPTGTPVYAASDGVIVTRGDYGANGNYIALKHNASYLTGYSHLSRFEKGLSVGDKVKRLQVIGYVGSTGRSTGPHLHFSAKKNGVFIDPESLGLDALSALPASELSVFRKIKSSYDTQLDAVKVPPAPVVATSSPALVQTPALRDNTTAGAASPISLPGRTRPPAPVAMQDPAAPSQPVIQLPNIPSQTVTVTAAAPAVTTLLPVETARAPAPPKARRTYESLYLSDKELIQAQSFLDEGEVEE